jgi:hypothetical protein
MSNDNTPLTEAELAEYETARAALKKSMEQDPVGTKQAMKDALDFPRKSGDVK